MRHYSREEAFFSVSAISCASAAGSASGWRSVARGRLIRTSCIRRPVDKKLFVIDWVESLHRCPAWSSYPAGMEVHCSAMPLLPPDTSPGIDGKRRGLAFDLGIKLADNRGRAPGGADSALLRRSAGGAGWIPHSGSNWSFLSFCLAFSGFFSSTETSLFSLSSFQIDQMRAAKNPRIELIERLRSEPRRLIVTILIGNEFVNVSASVISAAMVIHLFGADNEMINLLVMVPILLLFGEITPKVLAIRNNVAFANAECRPIALFARLITPLREVIRHVADFFITLIVGKQRSQGNLVTEDMIRTLVHDAVGEGALDSQEAQYIEKIFDFGSKSLSDIMRPRSDIQFLSADLPVAELLAQIKATRQSRYPVFKGHRDTILGILYTRDLLGVDLAKLERDPQGFRKLLRQPNFFPESKPAVELFHTFRQRKLSFALIVDEYGGVTGLVTMEDLLECVFGEIYQPFGQRGGAAHLVSELPMAGG
jgi:putative hemolysin